MQGPQHLPSSAHHPAFETEQESSHFLHKTQEGKHTAGCLAALTVCVVGLMCDWVWSLCVCAQSDDQSSLFFFHFVEYLPRSTRLPPTSLLTL